jgi:hypothetical protein
MRNLKIIVALLSAMLISSASVAGELTVTGNAKATMNIGSSDSAAAAQETGRTLSVENELVFGASGELDNGTTWKYSMQLDAGAVDDPTITLTNNFGTIGIFGGAGGLNAKHFGSANAVAYGSQFGRGNGTGEFQDPADIGAVNNIQYHTPAGLLPLGIVGKVSKGFTGASTNKPGDAPLASSAIGDSMSYSIDIAPIENLALQASYTTVDQTTAIAQDGQSQESGAIGAKYTMGNFTAGYSRGYHAPASPKSAASGTVATINEYVNDSYSIGVKVNDNLSVSYGKEESTANYTTDSTADVTAEIDVIQAAYTMGGLTTSVSVKNVDNLSYDTTQDTKEATIFLTLAF